MSLTKFTLNIISWNLCRCLFRKRSTGFNRSCYLSCLSNCSNKFIMSFSPISRSIFLIINFRFCTIFIKLKSNVCLFFSSSEKENQRKPVLFLSLLNRVHPNQLHVVFRYRKLSVVFERLFYKLVDVYAIRFIRKMNESINLLIMIYTSDSTLKHRPQLEHGYVCTSA
jgi:hypothetical protein